MTGSLHDEAQAVLGYCDDKLVHINRHLNCKLQTTGSLSHLKKMLPKSSSRPLRAKRPNHTTQYLFDPKSRKWSSRYGILDKVKLCHNDVEILFVKDNWRDDVGVAQRVISSSCGAFSIVYHHGSVLEFSLLKKNKFVFDYTRGWTSRYILFCG